MQYNFLGESSNQDVNPSSELVRLPHFKIILGSWIFKKLGGGVTPFS